LSPSPQEVCRPFDIAKASNNEYDTCGGCRGQLVHMLIAISSIIEVGKLQVSFLNFNEDGDSCRCIILFQVIV
jgi:hypothetical protein